MTDRERGQILQLSDSEDISKQISWQSTANEADKVSTRKQIFRQYLE